MKLKTIFSKIMFFPISVCAFACFLCCFDMPVKKAFAGNYDYSSANEKYTLNAKDIFTKEIGVANELESNYLEKLDYQLSYSDNQEKENVVTSIIDDKLYVFAYESTSVGANEKDVKWVPLRATYNGSNYDFISEGDHYLALINDYDEQVNDVSVSYCFDAEISKEDADNIYNGAFNYAKEQSEKIDSQNAEYNQAKQNYDQYLLDLDAYNQNKIAWDDYDAANEAYNIYKNKYNEYQTKYANYVANKEAWDKYNQDLAIYNKYLADLAYYNANYEQNLIDYNNFYPNYQKFEYRLNAMNLIYKSMAPMNRTIYDQVMGESVTQVLNRKSDLVALGVSEALIDKAYVSTLELRIIFEAYKAKETDAEKYTYYRNNYATIKLNVENLLRALDKLYRSSFVPEAIGSMGSDKTEKYLNLIAQLAYLANAIDDKEVYNEEGWNGISGTLKPEGAKIIDDSWLLIGKTWREYLQGEEFLDVNSETIKAYPSEPKFPTEVVELLVEPDPVEEPTAPTETLTEPIEPSAVEEPIAPTEKLSKPETVNEPHLEDYLNYSDEEYIYAQAYKSAELVKRKEINDKEYVRLNSNCVINVQEKLTKVCRFLNYDGTFLAQDFFTNNPIYNGKTPFKEQDSTYNDYLFQGWDDLNGNNVDLENVNNSIELKARFLGRNLDKFDITFVIEERVEVFTCPVGELPNMPNDLTIPDTENHFYVFSNWDKEIELVHKAETYTAVFEEKNKYQIDFDIDGTITSQMVREGEMPIIPNIIEKADSGNNYYVFTSWDKDIEVVTKAQKYSALFDEFEYVNITWVIDGNETVSNFKQNEVVAYNSSNPYKESDDTYYYDFISWDFELGFEAVENKTITAIFEQKRFIKVTWYTHDGEINGVFRADEHIDSPKVNLYFDDCYIYSFDGFIKQANSTIYDVYYNAQYLKDYILYSEGSGVRIHAQNNIINIYLDDRKTVDLTTLFALFNQGYEINDIKIIGNTYNISISKLQLQQLINRGCRIISLKYNDLGNKEYEFSLDVLNKNNEKITNLGNIVINLELKGSFDSLRSYVYIESEKQNAEITENTVILNIKPNTKYAVYPMYSVKVYEYDGGEITVNTLLARFGTEITMEYTLKPGYVFENFVINDTDVTICNTDGKYTIKGHDITIGMAISRMLFKITFYVDDEVYAVSYVFYGEKIVAPSYVSKMPTETTRFVFEKWDKNMAEAYQNEDFHAIFTEVEIPKPPVTNKVSVVTVIEIVGVSLLVVGITGALLIIFRKKIFKRY